MEYRWEKRVDNKRGLNLKINPKWSLSLKVSWTAPELYNRPLFYDFQRNISKPTKVDW